MVGLRWLELSFEGVSLIRLADCAAVLMAGFLLSAAGPAAAGPTVPPGCTAPPEALVQELLDWIAANSDYDTAQSQADPPEVVFCDAGDAIDYAGADTLVEPGERGLYDFEARRIFLVAPWAPDDPHDVAVLLHELVHDVQFSARTWECPNATEWEAYELHEAWLAERDIDADIDWLSVYFWSSCRRNPHVDAR